MGLDTVEMMMRVEKVFEMEIGDEEVLNSSQWANSLSTSWASWGLAPQTVA